MTDVAAQLRDLVARTDAADLPMLIGTFASAQALAMARLVGGRAPTQNAADAPHILTAEQIAARFNVPVTWVRAKARSHELPVVWCGRYARFDPDAVASALANLRAPRRQPRVKPVRRISRNARGANPATLHAGATAPLPSQAS